MKSLIKLPRNIRSRYMLEVQHPQYGKMYAFPKNYSRNILAKEETIIRLKFEQRKWQGGFCWDVDKNQMHIFSVRVQQHKRFRFGWEYNAFRMDNEPLGNLKKVKGY